MKVQNKVTKYTLSVPQGLIVESKSITMGATVVLERHEVLYATVSVPEHSDAQHDPQVQIMGRRVGKRGKPVRGTSTHPLYVVSLIRHEDGRLSERDELADLRQQALASVESYEVLSQAVDEQVE